MWQSKFGEFKLGNNIRGDANPFYYGQNDIDIYNRTEYYVDLYFLAECARFFREIGTLEVQKNPISENDHTK